MGEKGEGEAGKSLIKGRRLVMGRRVKYAR